MNTWSAEKVSIKVNVLLSLIGNAAKKKYSNFYLKPEEITTTDNVIKLIKERLVIRNNVMYERYVFHNCNQNSDENFDQYLIRLKKIIETFDYNQTVTSEIMLRDRIAFGIKDMESKRRFLRDEPDKLTLDRIVQACKVAEATTDRIKMLDGGNEINVILKKKMTWL